MLPTAFSDNGEGMRENIMCAHADLFVRCYELTTGLSFNKFLSSHSHSIHQFATIYISRFYVCKGTDFTYSALAHLVLEQISLMRSTVRLATS